MHLLKEDFPRRIYQTPRGGASHHNVAYNQESSMFVGRFEEDASFSELSGYTDCQVYQGPDKVSVYCWGTVYNLKELGCAECLNTAELFYGLYKKDGIRTFSKADGSFTFIIRIPDELLIGRDHHGTKHQVYYNATHYASSLMQLTKTEGFISEPYYKALTSFLSIGYIATPNSAFTNVHKLGAGELLIYRSGKFSVLPLFETNNIKPSFEIMDLEELSARYGELHIEAIQRRIKGKQKIGILLSGGYDSGCNLVALRQQYSGNIHSFSIGFKGDNWSELPLAKCMSDTFKTIHNIYEIDGSEISALPEIVRFLGDPFIEGGLLVNYAAMKLVGANKPDIVLGGDGSDQYFGTSGREQALHYLIRKYGIKPFVQLTNSILSQSTFEKDSTFYRLKRQTDKILRILDGDLFGFSNCRLSEMLQNPDFLPTTKKEKIAFSSFEQLYTTHVYQTDIEKTINQVILFKASKLAALFGNEIAFPYMDLTLYDFLQRLPVEYKFRSTNLREMAKGNATAKFLLKYHYKPMLPQEITTKKKQGGFVPMPLFFADKKQRDGIAEYILSSNICTNFLKREKLEAFVKQYDLEAGNSGSWFWYRQNKAIQYFSLYALAIWWEIYIKGNETPNIDKRQSLFPSPLPHSEMLPRNK